jgi:CCR4-NOT transcription complex subunit 9
MSTLLQEIISVYPLLNPPELTPHASNRVCNALALLQCVASHPETRDVFLKAHIPLFLYPFLNTTSKSRPFEYLRLTSLGVIGALVKSDSPPTIEFLLTTEIIPLCLRIMETGSELSKVYDRRVLANCRLSPFSFCKKYYWMTRVYSISAEHTNDFWLLRKCSVSW